MCQYILSGGRNSGIKQTRIETNHFMHYSDGSLVSFSYPPIQHDVNNVILAVINKSFKKQDDCNKSDGKFHFPECTYQPAANETAERLTATQSADCCCFPPPNCF